MWGQKTSFKLFWRISMMVQLAVVYTWFVWASLPLSELLPLYHCRMAMFILLFSPKGRFKDYFALIGVIGSILAMLVPALYPHRLLHLTNVFFFTGHFGLFALSLMHLKTSDTVEEIDLVWLGRMTIFLNSFLLLVNLLTDGNYGFLADTPILHTKNVLLNLLLVSGVFMLLLTPTVALFQRSSYRSQLVTIDKKP